MKKETLKPTNLEIEVTKAWLTGEISTRALSSVLNKHDAGAVYKIAHIIRFLVGEGKFFFQ